MNDEIIQRNKEKISFAFRDKIKLHITLKDKSWRNGYVVSFTDSTFVLHDLFNGDESFFYMDLEGEVEPYNYGFKKGVKDGTR